MPRNILSENLSYAEVVRFGTPNKENPPPWFNLPGKFSPNNTVSSNNKPKPKENASKPPSPKIVDSGYSASYYRKKRAQERASFPYIIGPAGGIVPSLLSKAISNPNVVKDKATQQPAAAKGNNNKDKRETKVKEVYNPNATVSSVTTPPAAQVEYESVLSCEILSPPLAKSIIITLGLALPPVLTVMVMFLVSLILIIILVAQLGFGLIIIIIIITPERL